MSIFVDELFQTASGEWAHLWTDGDDEALDKFAAQLGLKKEYAHTSNGISGRFYHYDLRATKRRQAIKLGAVKKPLREWVEERLEAAAGKSRPKINRYTCEKCAQSIITIDTDNGTTPMAVDCQVTARCSGFMYSAYYMVDQTLTPTHEWYKPNIKRLKGQPRQHVQMGGLMLRKIEQGESDGNL